MELVAGAAQSGRGNFNALVLANTCDLDEPNRPARVQREIEALRGLGFAPRELDLREYFDPARRSGLAALLADAGLVWARGGNSFVYRRALRQSGFDALITGALRRDALVYGGYSGGIAVLAPSLEGIEIVNDPDAVPPGYDPAVLRDGLGLLPYHIAPHYKSAHPASPGIDKVVKYFEDHRMPYKTLRDGEAIVVDGAVEETVA